MGRRNWDAAGSCLNLSLNTRKNEVFMTMTITFCNAKSYLEPGCLGRWDDSLLRPDWSRISRLSCKEALWQTDNYMNHDCVHFPKNELVQTWRTYAELRSWRPSCPEFCFHCCALRNLLPYTSLIPTLSVTAYATVACTTKKKKKVLLFYTVLFCIWYLQMGGFPEPL